jgi:hypothetical protein
MDVLQILAITVHTLGLVIALGYYGLLGRLILPALRPTLDGPGLVAALVALERRAMPLVVLSAVAFSLTGAWLLVDSPQYAGPGNVFASTWTTLMLLKHVLIAGIVGLALLVHRQVGRIGAALPALTPEADLRRLSLYAEGLTALGAIVILLTATAQVVR